MTKFNCKEEPKAIPTEALTNNNNIDCMSTFILSTPYAKTSDGEEWRRAVIKNYYRWLPVKLQVSRNE
jgi:hypothetical protein